MLQGGGVAMRIGTEDKKKLAVLGVVGVFGIAAAGVYLLATVDSGRSAGGCSCGGDGDAGCAGGEEQHCGICGEELGDDFGAARSDAEDGADAGDGVAGVLG